MQADWQLSTYTSNFSLINKLLAVCACESAPYHHMAARGLKGVSRWFSRSSTGPREEDKDSNEKNGLLRSHLDQVVPVAEFGEGHKALHVEPKTVALKVSMHCHGCARKVEKQVSKLEGVVSFKVELENKKVTVVGNVNPAEVLDSICKVMKRAEILAAP